MSVRCKMDGGKFFNRIQSGSFQHRCMAAALRVQYGSGWVAHVWQLLFKSSSDIMDVFAGRRKRKHFLDSARKVTQKYKKRRLESKLGHSKPDHSYGDSAMHPDIASSELDRLCKEYLSRLQVMEQQQQRLAIQTSRQHDDSTGRWAQEHRVRITASHFGKICKRRTSYGPLTTHLLYVQCRETPSMRYGRVNEPHVREQYTLYLQSKHHTDASVTTRIHIDLQVKQ